MAAVIKKYVLLFLFFIGFGDFVFAQFIEVLDVNNDNYPKVELTFKINSDSSININSIDIYENNLAKQFSIKRFCRHKKSVALLIDHTLYSDEKANKIIHSLLDSSFANLNKCIFVNIEIIKFVGDTTYIKPLSIEFTNNYKNLLLRYRTEISSEINYENITTNISSYLKEYAIMDRELMFINNSYFYDNYKRIKILSDSLNLQYTQIYYPDLSKKETSEIFNLLVKQVSKSEFDDYFIDSGSGVQEFKLSYISNSKNKVNSLTIQYKDEICRINVKRNKAELFIYNQLWFNSFLIILLIVIIIIMILLMKKQPKFKNKKILTIQFKNKAASNPFITIKVNNIEQNFEMTGHILHVGRAKDNDVLIPHLTVSNHHAIIRKREGVIYIEDNNSTNGVLVNDMKVKQQAINPKDTIRLGKAILTISC